MSQANNLSKDRILPVIIKFYIPLLCTNLLQQIYTIADTAIVGKGLGDNMLAAVGNMASLIFLVFGFASGLSNGFAVIVIFMPLIGFPAAAVAEITSWTVAMIINICAFTYHLKQRLSGKPAISNIE